jgi:15-cis-phytoene synthase
LRGATANRDLVQMLDVASVAKRARGENFPVASLAFPRELRPHIRALYAYARLVDILGDELEGGAEARLAALDELEREVDAAFRGAATWPVLVELQPTIREFNLPREPFLRLIEANRMDQRISEYETWEDVKRYCVHSADPCGRLVLGVLRRADDSEIVALSDDVCTGLQLVNFLQDVPRDLALGRVYLPAEDLRRFGVTELDRSNEPLRQLLEFEAGRARGLLSAGEPLGRRLGGRTGRAVTAFARGGLAAVEALERARFDVFSGRPKPSRARLARTAIGGPRPVMVEAAYAEVERLTRQRARNFAYGIMLLPRPKRRAIAAVYAFARQVDDIADGPLPDLEKRVLLEQLRGQLDAPPGEDAMLVALADARQRFSIPTDALLALIDGGVQDTEQTRYADFDELRGYCVRVAGAVGRACVAVYGADEPERAETLGIALQLINIVRDVAEDWSLGRVYLPQDELARFDVEEDDIARGLVTPEWGELMGFQAERARAHLAEGLTLLDHLDRRSAACVATFAGLYRSTLDRIERDGFDVFGGAPTLSPVAKLRVVGAALAR